MRARFADLKAAGEALQRLLQQRVQLALLHQVTAQVDDRGHVLDPHGAGLDAGHAGGATTQKRKDQSGQELNKKIREDFDSNWLRIYPWLEQSEDINGKTVMFCSWCKNANKENIFTTGTQSFRKQTLERHLNIDDHKIAAVAKDKSQVSIV